MTDTNAKITDPPSNWVKHFGSWGLLFGFIVGVAYWLGWGNILRPWLAFSVWQVVAGLGLIFVSYGLRTLRLYDYFKTELRGHWWGAFRLMMLHNILNILLPARAGELSFPLLMKRYFGVVYAHSVSALLWFRLLDLHTILTFAIYPLLVITPLRRFVIPVILLWMLIPLIVYGLRHFIERRYIGVDGKVSELVKQALHGLPDNAGQFWKSWLLTWLNWLVKLLTLAWVLGQFVGNISFNGLIGAVVAGELTSVLPFHAPGGVGTYEAGIVAALSPLTNVEIATAGAINVHLFVLGAAVLGGLVGWLLPKPEVQSEAPSESRD